MWASSNWAPDAEMFRLAAHLWRTYLSFDFTFSSFHLVILYLSIFSQLFFSLFWPAQCQQAFTMRVSFTETARPQNPPEIPQRPEPHVKSISICVGLFYFVGSERDSAGSQIVMKWTVFPRLISCRTFVNTIHESKKIFRREEKGRKKKSHLFHVAGGWECSQQAGTERARGSVYVPNDVTMFVFFPSGQRFTRCVELDRPSQNTKSYRRWPSKLGKLQ